MSIKPALTPEEWDKWLECLNRPEEEGGPNDRGWCVDVIATAKDNVHGAAAVALHGQPFGFTREDVQILWALAAVDIGWQTCRDELLSLADRIEALLPPLEGA